MSSINIVIADSTKKDLELIKKEVNNCSDISIVGEFNNALDILEFIKKNNVDVIVCELTMPYMDSVTLLNEINSLDRNYRPQIIIVSNISSQDIIDRVMNNGAYYYLLKPFNSNLLMNRIRDSVNQKNIHSLDYSYETFDSKENDLTEIKISELLKDLGTPPHLKGYWFLKDAILLASKDEYNLKSIARCIYPNIASKYSTTSNKVERGIRRAIEITCERGHKQSLIKIFNINSLEGDIKITNHQFISILARKIH